LDFAVVEVFPSVGSTPALAEVHIFLGNANGTFTSGPIYPIGTVAGQTQGTNHIIAVGHFDGPGSPLGIAVAMVADSGNGCSTGGVDILYGNGNGSFQTPACLPNPSPVTSLVVADYNNDTYDDIAVGNASGAAAGSISV
jgi:hypothetical protein